VASTYDLALAAIAAGQSLAEAAAAGGERIAYDAVAGRLLTPIDHPDPAHCLVTGTGLTHLGSADARDKMHQEATKEESVTDSMAMFRL